MTKRLAVILVGAAIGGVALAGCAPHRSSAPIGDGGSAEDTGPATCPTITEERAQCHYPVDTRLCQATWATRDAAMCGLRVYEGPAAGYLVQYVSYNDVPPLGGPSWMCIYEPGGTQQLAGAWALDHYLRWCCGQSLDMFQGVATDEIANLAAAMATHPPCADAGP